jgi:hypothetical protein
MDASEISNRVKETYESFESYEDSGWIRGFRGGSDGWFRTLFMRPDQLLFEWSNCGSEDSKQTLIVKGNKAQILHSKEVWALHKKNKALSKTMSDLEKVMTDRMPLSFAGGTSHGLSDMVVPLLVSDPRRPCWPRKPLWMRTLFSKRFNTIT